GKSVVYDHRGEMVNVDLRGLLDEGAGRGTGITRENTNDEEADDENASSCANCANCAAAKQASPKTSGVVKNPAKTTGNSSAADQSVNAGTAAAAQSSNAPAPHPDS
ncbi:unnamed protein product, partial [Amoebophrya sp. A25]